MARPPEPIVTGEAVALDLRDAGIGSRGIAFLLDELVVVGVLVVVYLVEGALLAGSDSAAQVAVVLATYVLGFVGYPAAFETLSRGRTLGKMAMGLRVVRDDGGPIRFRHAIVRSLVGVVVERPGFTVMLGAFIPMLLTSRGKRLGDLLAGTVVIQERMPQPQPLAPWVPNALAGWAATLDLSGVDDAMALRMRSFLGRVSSLTPAAAQSLGSAITAEVAARVGPPPPGASPWAYLGAIVAERQRRAMLRQHPGYAAAPAKPPPPGVPAAPVPTVDQAEPPPPPASGGFALPR